MLQLPNIEAIFSLHLLNLSLAFGAVGYPLAPWSPPALSSVSSSPDTSSSSSYLSFTDSASSLSFLIFSVNGGGCYPWSTPHCVDVLQGLIYSHGFNYKS